MWYTAPPGAAPGGLRLADAMAEPDFLCIGARKAGTTWLHENLARHPRVWVPPVKEMHVLDHPAPWLVQRLFGRSAHLRRARRHLRETLRAARRGEADREALRWAARYALLPRGPARYGALFPDRADRVKGEVCPGYARTPEPVVAALASRAPGLRVIYLLRDPIDCAWSSAVAHFAKKEGRVGAAAAPAERVERYLAKENSLSHLRYARNLAVWERHLPSAQVRVAFYDDLAADPRALFRRILAFLGLEEEEGVPDDVERRRGWVPGRRPEIPERHRRFLARLHLEELAALHARLEHEVTGRWLARARAAAGDR